MDHSKRRSAYAAVVEADAIDLGHEPPLSVDGEAGGLVDRRQVSVQWFSGTILTGLCGAALMGGAVFASLDLTMRTDIDLVLQDQFQELFMGQLMRGGFLEPHFQAGQQAGKPELTGGLDELVIHSFGIWIKTPYSARLRMRG